MEDEGRLASCVSESPRARTLLWRIENEDTQLHVDTWMLRPPTFGPGVILRSLAHFHGGLLWLGGHWISCSLGTYHGASSKNVPEWYIHGTKFSFHRTKGMSGGLLSLNPGTHSSAVPSLTAFTSRVLMPKPDFLGIKPPPFSVLVIYWSHNSRSDPTCGCPSHMQSTSPVKSHNKTTALLPHLISDWHCIHINILGYQCIISTFCMSLTFQRYYRFSK